MVTDADYRKHPKHAKRLKGCWGAVYTLKEQRKRLLRMLAAGGCMLSAIGIMVYCIAPEKDFHEFPQAITASAEVEQAPSVRKPAEIVYAYPSTCETEVVTFTMEQLLRGRMLLIDAEHPLPKEAPSPNTFCVASNGRGVVPVESLSVKASSDTIDALYELFWDLRQHGMEGLVVTRGTLTASEQREWQLSRLRVYAATLPLENAVALARDEIDEPNQSEHQQSYCVDIRLSDSFSGSLNAQPLEQSEQGRFLLRSCWRHGFIRRYPQSDDPQDKAWHFRYVGIAHATAMTYLDLALEDYLPWLHEQRVLQIQKDGAPQYLIACSPVIDGYASVTLPKNAVYEASYDNMGYAVVSCIVP